MLYFLTVLGIVAHTCFWGAGLACFAVPRIWKRWTFAFVPGLGFALQSAVVWLGAHTLVDGTDAYAWWSELLPLSLLIFAAFRRGDHFTWKWLAILGVGLVSGWMLVSPLTEPGTGLTTSSLGSCDQADYAAGARVFKEFASDDRVGFMGLPEVTQVRSAEYFFDFWVRLNHFTPSALIAHHASIFGVEPFRLVSVSAVALVLLNLPIVFFLARLIVGLRGVWLLGLVALYALSPLSAYAVFHGQLGQLYAAQGISLLTVAVYGASQQAQADRSPWVLLPLLLSAFWILAGSYNFILLVCLAPAGAWLLLQLARRRNWRAFSRSIAVVVVSFVWCAVLFWGRFDGLMERFSLFEQYNFGWAMPLLSPEGLLGMLRNPELGAWPLAVRVSASALVIAGFSAGLWSLWRREGARAWAALALVVPVMIGWAMLARETAVRANASYDAYKLISVFLPCLLAGLGCWLAAVRRAGLKMRTGAALALTAILGANLWVGGLFHEQMSTPPLRVNPEVAEMKLVENDPRFASFNMLIDDYWSRLWVNAFLLRKPQYFATHTYEGRLNTELKGEWNLSDSLLSSVPLAGDDFVRFNSRFFAVRTSAIGLLQAGFGDGWYQQERAGKSRWRWSSGQGMILLNNPMTVPAQVQLRFKVRSIQPRGLTVSSDKSVLLVQLLDGSAQTVEIDSFVLPPGQTLLSLTSDAMKPGMGDERQLGLALYGLEMRTLALVQ